MDSNLISRLQLIQNKMAVYNQNIIQYTCPWIKNYYANLLNNEISKLDKLIRMMNVRQDVKQFTLEELSKYDGANGSPAYVAVNGIVYDVSLSPVWGGGTHFGLYAGKDLTNQFKACHGDQIKILDALPKVGELKVK